ncbi:MAG: sigma-70 family RNA polymerase sigma factor [Gemmataceae bacterium]|nr:sigma-70 family RNA polymerase sigma factor [Gemmataceae bacterium]
MIANLKQRNRHYLAAVVLGTALATLGGESAAAEEIPGQAMADVSRYCTACWRNARLPADRWGDCTQEVFRRLLERLEPAAWNQVLADEGAERRELMRAIDAVKKRTQRERRWSPCTDAVADPRETHERQLQEEREAVRQAADEVLTPRQKQIVQLTCAGWSVADMAKELSTSPARVSDEKYKAIHKLREHFQSPA